MHWITYTIQGPRFFGIWIRCLADQRTFRCTWWVMKLVKFPVRRSSITSTCKDLKFPSNSSIHCQNALNNAYDLIVVVGKKASGIFQSENRLATMKTNMWVAPSGANEGLTFDDSDFSSSSILFWVVPKSMKPINLPVSSKTRSFLIDTSSYIIPTQESISFGTALWR